MIDIQLKMWYNPDMKSKNKIKAVDLVGRDPFCGKTQGRAGVHLSRKNKLNNRKSKHARRELDTQLNSW